MNPLLLLLSAILFFVQPAQADNPATVSFGCAPWDGPTLEINIGAAPDMTLQVSIWAKGYDDLHKGERTIVINNRYISPGIADATGRAVMHDTRVIATPGGPLPYKEVDATVHFEKLEMKERAAASGYVQLEGGDKYPFEGTISAGGPCG